MHTKYCQLQLPRQRRQDLHYRADLYRRLAAAVSDGAISERLSALAARYQAEAEAHLDDD